MSLVNFAMIRSIKVNIGLFLLILIHFEMDYIYILYFNQRPCSLTILDNIDNLRGTEYIGHLLSQKSQKMPFMAIGEKCTIAVSMRL